MSSFLRAVPLLAVSALLVGLLSQARAEHDAQAAFRRGMAQVTVVAPATAPIPGQAAVDLALMLYGIEVPPSAEHPLYDAALKDRGLTSRGAFMTKAEVTVGPAAFTSWALLGSTLAHELEVHSRQNFLFIYVMDVVGLDGTGEAERQAYVHELRNAKRFGLEVADAELIADTMEYYYPAQVEGGSKAGLAVKTWLARNFLRGNRGF